MKYYEVIAKCGHVGKGNYIEKSFPIIAESAKDAAQKVLKYRKVKKHLKDAITSVKEINYDEYTILKKNNKDDLYLKSHCSQELDYENLEIKKLYYVKYHKRKLEFYSRKERVLYKLKKLNLIMEGLNYEYVY